MNEMRSDVLPLHPTRILEARKLCESDLDAYLEKSSKDIKTCVDIFLGSHSINVRNIKNI